MLQERGTSYSSIFLRSIDLPPAVPCHLLLFHPWNTNQDLQVRANPTSFMNWNTELSKSAQTFSVAHRDATVMIFSSWETFNRVLDDPVSYGSLWRMYRSREGLFGSTTYIRPARCTTLSREILELSWLLSLHSAWQIYEVDGGFFVTIVTFKAGARVHLLDSMRM